MKFLKRLTALTICTLLLAGLSACGGNGNTPSAGKPAPASGETAAATEGSYEKVVYAYATFNNIPTKETLATVEEAINEITREKIAVEVELMPIVIWDYSSQVSLALQGGEKIDVFQSLGDLNVAISTNMCRDITEIVDSCAAETKSLIGKDWLEACSSDGKLYGLPTYKPVALTPMIVYREDIAEELQLDMSKVNSVEDISAVLSQVKQVHPEMTPLAAVNAGNIGLGMCIEEVDYLTDDMYYPKGVLMDNEPTVVDYYASEEFSEICALARDWHNNGLVMKDAATTASTAAELMSSGNYFAYIAAYSYPEEDTAATLEAQCGGYPLGAKTIGSAYLDTTAVNSLTWAVSSTSKVPEAALKFLNLTFTDEDICNLLIYGIEGRDYVWNKDGTVRYPDGEEAATVPYTAQLSSGTLGNFFIMYPMEGINPDSLAWELEQNRTAQTSVAMGFTFDNSNVKTEYTAVANVIEQFLPGLICGSVDPETEIPVFLQRLEDAGLGTIIEEKQTQLDAWME